MYLLTKDIRLIRWLCNEAGGFYVSNPVPEIRKSNDQAIYTETRAMVRDFSEAARSGDSVGRGRHRHRLPTRRTSSASGRSDLKARLLSGS